MTQLQKQDYALGIFSSASLSSVGFDRTIFSSVESLRMDTRGDSPAARDRQMTEDWMHWLGRQERQDATPWFGMLFYDAPHGYDVPADAARAPGPILLAPLAACR